MSLQKQIMEDLKAAMKAKDLPTRDALRMLKTALTEEEIKQGRALDAAEELAVVQRAVKSRRESMAQYEEGGRADLADKERAEIAALEKYLPAQLSEEEARAAIEAIAAELGLTEKKQMGALMQAVMARHRGVIDGKLASKIAASLLR